jgi:hypothetical protein
MFVRIINYYLFKRILMYSIGLKADPHSIVVVEY